MKKEHILIIRFSALGDVAMTVPVVYSLAKTYPDLRITVLSRGFARTFFDDLAPNVNFMEADINGEYKGVKGLNALYRRLTAKKFTAIADFHGVLRSGYLRLRFNLDRYKVAHINKHRSERKSLVSKSRKVLAQIPTSFENYAEVLKNARKSAGITQQQLADKIGKKREYVAMLEKGETDMQLSTFIMISEALGLKFVLTY